MTTPETRQVTTVDIPLGPGRQTLRLILHMDTEGAPEALTLALGYGGRDGTAFMRHAWGPPLLSIPAAVIPELLDALSSLLVQETER